MKNLNTILFLLLTNAAFSPLFAQTKRQLQKPEQCGTMELLQARFERNPALKTRFSSQLETFNRTMVQKAAKPLTVDGVAGINGTNVTYTIPVVFHIVLNNPSFVTDAQIQSQLDVINKSYAGSNTDSVSIPAYFKSIFGKSGIQFCLAQRTPDGETTTGIDRVTTTKTSFSVSDDGVKHAASGGADIWNGDKYLNIWVCTLSDNLLGYGTFPNDGQPNEQGVVIEYRSIPGGSFSNFNGGKTLTHEIGHYFNLFHTWGDDDGACTGTDYVDDTPNQGNYTSGCYSGIKTDNCTTGGNGILYQDYMDYSYDQCLLLFTPLQADRMVTALLTYRSSLTVSDGCRPVISKLLDAKLNAIQKPDPRICAANFSPVVTVSNRGSQTLTSIIISAVVDNRSPVNYTWTGTLPSFVAATVTLNALTINNGIHHLKIFVSSPNALKDENNSNDTLTTTVQYYDAVSTESEGFEGNIFPPTGWDILNADESYTWKKVTGFAKTGNASVMMDNFDYNNTGQQDYLRLPLINLANIDSAYLSFQLAANTYSAVSASNNNWDTLEVLLSKDCGATYTSLYKKWGATLVTTSAETTGYFQPLSSQWRKDSINLTPYINTGNILLAFRNTTGNENNIYLDDINIKTQTINPNLKGSGFLVTPNPAGSGSITVQFYPNPVNLTGIQLYNMVGQKLAETSIPPGQGATAYNFDISRYPARAYIVRAVFSNRVLTKKFIRN